MSTRSYLHQNLLTDTEIAFPMGGGNIRHPDLSHPHSFCYLEPKGERVPIVRKIQKIRQDFRVQIKQDDLKKSSYSVSQWYQLSTRQRYMNCLNLFIYYRSPHREINSLWIVSIAMCVLLIINKQNFVEKYEREADETYFELRPPPGGKPSMFSLPRRCMMWLGSLSVGSASCVMSAKQTHQSNALPFFSWKHLWEAMKREQKVLLQQNSKNICVFRTVFNELWSIAKYMKSSFPEAALWYVWWKSLTGTLSKDCQFKNKRQSCQFLRMFT